VKTKTDSKQFEQILAEAEELLQKINDELMDDLEEEQRAQVEKHAQKLDELKSQLQVKTEKEGAPDNRSYGEGMHEAIEDIVKAIKTMAGYLR
jgi:chromosome segregation ATPase